jgi:hypothetical protein
MPKSHPERVISSLAYKAIRDADRNRGAVYSQYIILHFRATSDLAPGCDARDLFAWMDAQADVPEWAKTKVTTGELL